MIARLTFLTLLCAISFTLAVAQKSEPSQSSQPVSTRFSAADLAAKVPTPKPEDVKSADAIMRAIYEAISGPAGTRDWSRFRSLFLPQARFTQAGKRGDGSAVVSTWNVDEFIRDAGEVFAKESFYESGIVNQAESYGNITQVFSSYESRHSPGEKPFQRGINSVQLLNDGKRWWVLSILWDWERPDNPLPPKFAQKR